MSQTKGQWRLGSASYLTPSEREAKKKEETRRSALEKFKEARAKKAAGEKVSLDELLSRTPTPPASSASTTSTSSQKENNTRASKKHSRVIEEEDDDDEEPIPSNKRLRIHRDVEPTTKSAVAEPKKVLKPKTNNPLPAFKIRRKKPTAAPPLNGYQIWVRSQAGGKDNTPVAEKKRVVDEALKGRNEPRVKQDNTTARPQEGRDTAVSDHEKVVPQDHASKNSNAVAKPAIGVNTSKQDNNLQATPRKRKLSSDGLEDPRPSKKIVSKARDDTSPGPQRRTDVSRPDQCHKEVDVKKVQTKGKTPARDQPKVGQQNKASGKVLSGDKPPATTQRTSTLPPKQEVCQASKLSLGLEGRYQPSRPTTTVRPVKDTPKDCKTSSRHPKGAKIPPRDNATKPTSKARPSAAKSSQHDGPSTSKATTAPPSKPQKSSKRKHDDSDAQARPAKRQNIEVCPSTLKNRKHGCFINVILHTLASMPSLVDKLPAGKQTMLDLLQTTQQELDACSVTRSGAAALKKLKAKVEKLADAQKTSLTTCLAELIHDINRGGQDINPEILWQMNSAVFKDSLLGKADGSEQEDAGEYLSEVLQRLHEDTPEAGVQDMFAASMVSRMVCNSCSATKDLADHDVTLVFSTSQASGKSPTPVTELLQCSLEENSKFNGYACEKCKATSWTRASGWTEKRLALAPEYLQLHVLRNGGYAKNVSPLKLTTEPMKLSLCDGTEVQYEMIASVHHLGPRSNQGHYYSIRKIGDAWYDCDDTSRGGCHQVSAKFVENDERAGRASFLVLKKIVA